MFITLPSVHPMGAGIHRGGGREEEDPAGAGLPSPPLLQARKEVTGSAHTVVGGFVFTLQDSSGPLDTVSASRSDRQDVTMEMGGWLKARQPGYSQGQSPQPQSPLLGSSLHPYVVCYRET